MTSEAFTTTVTLSLALMPRSSTDSLVIEEVTVWPLPISTRTCEVVAPFFTSTTVPLIWLRALMRMMVLAGLGGAQRRHALLAIDYDQKIGTIVPASSAHACGAAKRYLTAFWSRMKSLCAMVRYGFASGAARTWRQAAGRCARVLGGFGLGGV